MNRVVVVLGATGGIGEAIALRFAQAQDNIVVCYNKNNSKAIAVVEEIEKQGVRVLTKQIDITSGSSIKKAFEEIVAVFGKIDVLVCAQGVADYNILIDDSDKNIESVIAINLTGTILANKCASYYMIKNHMGKIVNISSIWGEVGGSGETVYSASKAGIIGFSKALAKELGRSNINVNVVSPTTINVGMCKNLGKEIIDELTEQSTLGRLATKEDVASAVYFLASDEASSITGTVLRV